MNTNPAFPAAGGSYQADDDGTPVQMEGLEEQAARPRRIFGEATAQPGAAPADAGNDTQE